MNIVVLDKLALSSDHIARLERLGSVTVYDDFPDAATAVERLREADIAIVGWTALPQSAIERLSKVRYIALAQTGFELVAVEAAKARQVLISNVPEYSRQSVAEYAFALMLAALRHIPEAGQIARRDRVPTEGLLGNELYSKTLGILGLGSIGSRIGQIGQGFGMQVIGTSRTPKQLPGIKDVLLDVLLTESDVLVVAVDINPTTVGLLSADRLHSMKPGATLVSVVSNRVLDEAAVAELLGTGQLRSAAFDELCDQTSPLLEASNVVLSPQAGWYTAEAEYRLLELTIQNVEAFVAGEPTNLV
jgi:phosphoglycerate dehydrogenase-like enzyme